MSHTEPEQPAPVVPPGLRSFLYISGTIVLAIATAVVGDVPDLWVQLAGGYGTGALAVAAGYRPTRG